MHRPLLIAAAALLPAALAGAQSFEAQPKPDAKPPSTQPDGPKEKKIYMLMKTSMGEIVLELDNEKAPITVANFVTYANDGFYNGTTFHRVIPTFMIQGGGLTPDMTKKPTRRPITNEWRNGLKNKRGTIAMARTAQPDSATSQFFINVVDNANLDRPVSGGAGYAVFGRVIAGMDVVDKIRYVDTGIKKGRPDVPIEPVLIEKVSRITAEEAEGKRDSITD